MNTTLSVSPNSAMPELGLVARLFGFLRLRTAAARSTSRSSLSREELAELHERLREAERLRDEMRRTMHLARGY
jgi:hypothetical protein